MISYIANLQWQQRWCQDPRCSGAPQIPDKGGQGIQTDSGSAYLGQQCPLAVPETVAQKPKSASSLGSGRHDLKNNSLPLLSLPFPFFLYPAAQGMYWLSWTKIQLVGKWDCTSWLTGAHMSSCNYSMMCRVSMCKQNTTVELWVLLTHFLFSRWGGGCTEIIIFIWGVALQSQRAA